MQFFGLSVCLYSETFLRFLDAKYSLSLLFSRFSIEILAIMFSMFGIYAWSLAIFPSRPIALSGFVFTQLSLLVVKTTTIMNRFFFLPRVLHGHLLMIMSN